MRIIVNADDFGINERTTLAIDEAIASGLCTSTTLMVNMPYADEAVKLSRARGYFGRVGLHLNLTTGKPMTDAIRRSAMFCDEEGLFDGRLRKTRRLAIKGEDRALLRDEVLAQIRAFKAYQPTVFHMDSHHHVHAELAFLGAVGDLLRRETLQSIRISRNVTVGASAIYAAYKAAINARIRLLGARTADFFTDGMEAGLLAGKNAPNAVAEIMLHPRREGSGGPLLDRDAPIERAAESIERLGLEKTSYEELILGIG